MLGILSSADMILMGEQMLNHHKNVYISPNFDVCYDGENKPES